MSVTIAMTGATGNMGEESLKRIAELNDVGLIKLLVLDNKTEKREYRRLKKLYGHKIEAVFGDIGNIEACRRLTAGADYVLNLAGVIPPIADKYPLQTDKCNRLGVKNIISAIAKNGGKEPKLIHISSVAVYGNRNYIHPWGRVGDPLLPSVYDNYASSKLKGERLVLDCDLKNWVVLRQTGILHNNMLEDNMKDGLMFHTCYNVPIEWITSNDSGNLIKKIIERDLKGEIDGFWKKCYNMGGGASARVTGYDTFDAGFKLIGGSTEKFMRPSWNTIRNFHCMWFYDSDVLENLFAFRSEGVDEYWKNVLFSHPYYALARVLPKKLVAKFFIEKLLKDDDAPEKWIVTGDKGRIKAYFGSDDNIGCLPREWKDYAVLAKGRVPDGDVDYDALRDIDRVDKSMLLSHGYDENKPSSDLDIDDMKEAAAFRGGKCLSETMEKGDLYTKLLWECVDGHTFYASPYTILKAGHWCPVCCQPEPWDFDRLAKYMPFFAQVWYDTHAKGENTRYFFDSKHQTKYIVYRNEDLKRTSL